MTLGHHRSENKPFNPLVARYLNQYTKQLHKKLKANKSSGPSSNEDYLGHFKKLWLLTYLLIYMQFCECELLGPKL